MGNYATLKAAIQNVIQTNGNNEITGSLLQQTLLSMIGSLGLGYQYMGVASPITNPGTPDQNVFYLASNAGTYTNFGGIVLTLGECAILKYNGSWTKETTGFAAQQSVTQISKSINDLLKIVNVTPSTNLFDISAITEGYYMWTDGAHASSSLFYSDLIPVIPGHTYTLQQTPPSENRVIKSIRMVVGFDANGNHISSGAKENVTSITIPDGWAYVVFTYYVSQKNESLAFVDGTTIIPYQSFGSTVELKPNVVKTETVQDAAITEQKIADGAVSIAKMADGFFVNSDNLFNKDTITNNAYINIYTGNPQNSNNWWCSDFIAVDPTKQYTVNHMRSYCFYDSNKQRIPGTAEDVVRNNYTFTPPTGSVYLRFSSYIPSGTEWLAENVMLNEGNQLLPYVPYGKKLNPSFIKDYSIGTQQLAPNAILPSGMPALSKTGSLGIGEHFDSLTGIYTYNDFPQYLKRGMNVSVSCKFTSFSLLNIGVGKTTSGGVWIQVNATNAVLYRYNGETAYSLESKAHGLTISEFLNVSIVVNDLKPVVRIGTLSGIVELTYNEIEYELAGKPFVEIASGYTVTNVDFHISTKHFTRDIWIFGDSYMSWYNVRWPYQLVKNLNVNDFLLDGLAGGGSSALYNELQLALNFGKPRFLVWCLGMNDTFSAWSIVFANLKSLCANNGITLILQTIPWPTGGDKTDINNAVRQSGYRYFDGYAAVSSDDNGTWYDGMNSDGTHPTILGAQAMATRFVADFPEILQY